MVVLWSFIRGFKGYLLAAMDSVVTNVIKYSGTGESYGAQRTFGAIGMGVSSVIAGVVVQKYPSDTQSKYMGAFCVFLPLMVLLVPVCFICINKQAGILSWYTSTTEVLAIVKHRRRLRKV